MDCIYWGDRDSAMRMAKTMRTVAARDGPNYYERGDGMRWDGWPAVVGSVTGRDRSWSVSSLRIEVAKYSRSKRRLHAWLNQMWMVRCGERQSERDRERLRHWHCRLRTAAIPIPISDCPADSTATAMVQDGRLMLSARDSIILIDQLYHRLLRLPCCPDLTCPDRFPREGREIHSLMAWKFLFSIATGKPDMNKHTHTHKLRRCVGTKSEEEGAVPE